MLATAFVPAAGAVSGTEIASDPMYDANGGGQGADILGFGALSGPWALNLYIEVRDEDNTKDITYVARGYIDSALYRATVTRTAAGDLVDPQMNGSPVQAYYDATANELRFRIEWDLLGSPAHETLMTNMLAASKNPADGVNWDLTDPGEYTILRDNAPVWDSISNQVVSEPELLQFTVSAIDPDGDTVSYRAELLPEGATLDSATGEVSWQTDYYDNGVHYVDFFASDGTHETHERIRIDVVDVNGPPVFDPVSHPVIQETDLLEFTVSAQDPDADTLTYRAEQIPDDASFDAATGEFSWQTDYVDADNYDFHFFVSDGVNEEVETVVFVSVTNLNRAPVFDEIEDQMVRKTKTVSFTVSATDADGEPITYSAPSLPPGASFDASTGDFTWTPTVDQGGQYIATFAADDGIDTTTEDVIITVGDGSNYAPDIRVVYTTTPFQEGSPGDALTFTMTVTNHAAHTEAIRFATGAPEGWSTSVDKSGIYYLAPGDSLDVTTTVNVALPTLDGRAMVRVDTALQPGAYAFFDAELPVFVNLGLDKELVTMEEAVTGTVSAVFLDGAPAEGVDVQVREAWIVGMHRFQTVTLDAAGEGAFAFPVDTLGSNAPGEHAVTARVSETADAHSGAGNAEASMTLNYEVESPVPVAGFGFAPLFAGLPLVVVPSTRLLRARG